ncbi:uncharacterized protein LOC127794461 isoform X2 [Diospyros lotus]|uniref:uncharacterized protein LOC127794461 isoform X2 n=1 Tax=Diospyros lotus TaxID=55363 RepID=UPI0022591F4B|nr:uncharacterized protein LOC127794461 isoform X2 [Diospyros lotus]
MKACTCRSLLRVDRAWEFTNSCWTSKPVQYLKECCFHHGLNYKGKIGWIKNSQGLMDRKKRRTITPIWRPVLRQSTLAQVKELRVESEDLHEIDDGGKVEDGSEVQEVHILNSASDTQCTHHEGKAADGPAGPTLRSETIQGNGEGTAPENASLPSEDKHSVSVKVGAALMRFIKGKGGSTQKNIEEETGVKIVFPSSKEDAIIIEGISAESVSRASEKVQVIVDEAVKSPNLDYSHFISLPLAIHPELVHKLVHFQQSVLGANSPGEDENLDSDSNEDIDEDQELDKRPDVAVKLKVEDDNENVKVDITNIHRISYLPKASNSSELKVLKPSTLSDLGIERSIFIKPKTFHLTVLMLKLWNNDRVDAAAEVLKSISPKVLEALDGRPISIRLKGLECMRGSPAKARVIYAPVEEIGSEGRLLHVCQVIIGAFVEAGLVLEKDAAQTLKLHATVMNARHRKRKKRTRKLDSFDARGIFKQFGSEEWGEYLIRELHLSQRFAFDENGYYHCCASIPFPESMQLD